MPQPTNTYKITFGGALPGGEIWQCGLTTRGVDGGTTQANLQAAVDVAATIIVAWWNKSGAAIARVQGASLDRITAYRIPAGQVKASQVAAAQFAAPVGTQTQKLPNQAAVVVTLVTQNPGRTGKGRFYIPCLADVMTGPQMSAAVTADIAAAARTMIQDLSNTDAIGYVIGGTSGAPVTSIKVDSVVDTQRRRRNSLRATTNTSLPVTTP